MRRGRHRASKQCADHIREIARANADLKWFKDQCGALNREVDRLRGKLGALQRELGTEDPTHPIPVAELRAEIRSRAPEMIKGRTAEGFTILLPVGSGRARRHRPSWALRD